jgi:hypothetical protein
MRPLVIKKKNKVINSVIIDLVWVVTPSELTFFAPDGMPSAGVNGVNKWELRVNTLKKLTLSKWCL